MVYTLMVLMGVVYVTRFSPLLFAKRLQGSAVATRLSAFLTPCILALLVAHTLRDTPVLTIPYGIPALTGLVATVGAHMLWRKLILSLVVGVGAYAFTLNTLVL